MRCTKFQIHESFKQIVGVEYPLEVHDLKLAIWLREVTLQDKAFLEMAHESGEFCFRQAFACLPVSPDATQENNIKFGVLLRRPGRYVLRFVINGEAVAEERFTARQAPSINSGGAAGV